MSNSIQGPLFSTGPIVATPGVMAFADPRELAKCLNRHLVGDWGNVDAHDKKTNDEAVKSGDRILSVYEVSGKIVWIITDAMTDEGTRYATTFLLPSEY